MKILRRIKKQQSVFFTGVGGWCEKYRVVLLATVGP